MRDARIVVVEDEAVAALALRKQLIALGHSVIGLVSSGRQLLDRAAELLPDLVLMDIAIDGEMDGVETAERLRGRCAAPVVFVTGNADDATLERVRAINPYGFVLKPFTGPALHAAIQVALARHAEEQVLRSEGERFRDFSRIASDWFWEQDAAFRFLWISDTPPGADRIVEAFAPGRTRWETVDRGVSEAQWAEHHARLERREPIRDFRFERLDAAGEVHHLSVSGDPVLDRHGRLVGYRGTGQDITARIRAERALSLAIDEAVSASRSKSQFLANMSHELRTPLNAILGFAEVMRDEMMGPLDPRYREYASDIFTAGRHLLRVIGDVLDLSKIEAGHMKLREEPVDLAQMIAGCCKLIRARAAAAGIGLEVRVPGDLPRALADRSRLEQVVLNLLANAVKFTPVGGRIRIEAGPSADGGLCLCVADTGIGMSAKDIPIALAPFQQVEGHLARRHEGTGLGLPIAKKLIELHGGRLSLESEPGRGTTVRLHLPPARILARDCGAPAGDPATGRHDDWAGEMPVLAGCGEAADQAIYGLRH